jgi:hypothetical protein
MLKMLKSGFVAATAVVVLVIAVGAAQHFSLLPHLGNPVQEKTVDRTGPVLLKSLSDLSEYHASTAEFEVTVDLEKDVQYVPSFVAGEKVIYDAIGSADGVVDLSDLDARTVQISSGNEVVVTVPHATVGKVTLDIDRSKVVSRDRGLVNRAISAFNDSPTSEKGAQIAGRNKLTAAAQGSGLRQRAERNTRVFLTDILETAGASKVTVRFVGGDKS